MKRFEVLGGKNGEGNSDFRRILKRPSCENIFSYLQKLIIACGRLKEQYVKMEVDFCRCD